MARANPADPHFGLLHWKGNRVRKQDILVAKNYLSEDEIDTLNRIIGSNGFPVLAHAGSISHAQMESAAHALYLDFDQRRKHQEALQADQQDEAELKALENALKRRSKP